MFSTDTKPKEFEQKIFDFDKEIKKLNSSDKIYDNDVDNIFKVMDVLVEALCKASENIDKKKAQLPDKIDIETAKKQQEIKEKTEALIFASSKLVYSTYQIKIATQKNWDKKVPDKKDSQKEFQKRAAIQEKEEKTAKYLYEFMRSLQSKHKGQRDLSIKALRKIVSEDYEKTNNPTRMNVEEFLEQKENNEDKIPEQNSISYNGPTGYASNFSENNNLSPISELQKDVTLDLYYKRKKHPMYSNSLNSLEIEYYAYFLNSVNVNSDNNFRYRLGNIKNERLKKFIKNKNKVNDDCIVVEAKFNSPLKNTLHNSIEFRNDIRDILKEKSLSKNKLKIYGMKFSNRPLSTVIGRSVLYLTIDTNGDLTGYLIDYYDFEWRSFFEKNKLDEKIRIINNNAFEQQQKGQGTPYILLIPIYLPKNTLKKLSEEK